MALIKCSECGKEISDIAKKCPNCGMKIKNKKSKKTILFSATIIFLILISIGSLFIYNNIQNQKRLFELKEQAKIIENKIENIISGEITDYNSIIEIKQEYDGLEKEVKEYVSNRKELENFKIELTADNFRDFFEIKVTLKEYTAKPKTGLITKKYDCFLTQVSIVQPKFTFKCNDVYVTIDYNYIISAWKGGYLNNIMLQDNGYYEESTEIHANDLWFKADEPTFFKDRWTVEKISGYITLE